MGGKKTNCHFSCDTSGDTHTHTQRELVGYRKLTPSVRAYAPTIGPKLRTAKVDFDRNYDNNDEFEIRYRNFDNVISIGCKNTAALC